MEHNDCLYVASVSERSVRTPPTDNPPSSQNYFQTNCRSVISKLLKRIEATLENLFKRNFADFGYVFAYFLRD